MKSIISRYGEMTSDPSALVDSEGEEMSLNRVDKALQTVGISIHDAAGQFRDFDDVIMELASKWNTIDKNTQRYIATIMAGNRQQSRFLALVSSYDRLKELTATAADSEDAAQLQYLKTLDSVDAKQQQMSNSLQSLYVNQGFEDVYKTTLDTINAIIQALGALPKIGKAPIGALLNVVSIFNSLRTSITDLYGAYKAKQTSKRTGLEEILDKNKEQQQSIMSAQEQAYQGHWDNLINIAKTSAAEIAKVRQEALGEQEIKAQTEQQQQTEGQSITSNTAVAAAVGQAEAQAYIESKQQVISNTPVLDNEPDIPQAQEDGIKIGEAIVEGESSVLAASSVELAQSGAISGEMYKEGILSQISEIDAERNNLLKNPPVYNIDTTPTQNAIQQMIDYFQNLEDKTEETKNLISSLSEVKTLVGQGAFAEADERFYKLSNYQKDFGGASELATYMHQFSNIDNLKNNISGYFQDLIGHSNEKIIVDRNWRDQIESLGLEKLKLEAQLKIDPAQVENTIQEVQQQVKNTPIWIDPSDSNFIEQLSVYDEEFFGQSQTVSVAFEVADEEIVNASNILNNLQEQLVSLKPGDNIGDELKEQFNSSQEQIKHLQELLKEVKVSPEATVEFNKEIEETIAKVEQLQEKVNATKNQPSQPAQQPQIDISPQIQKVNTELDTLSEKLKLLQANPNATDELKGKATELQVEADKLREGLNNLKANPEATNELEAKIKELNGQADELNNKLGNGHRIRMTGGIASGLTAAGSAARVLGMALQKNNKTLGTGVQLAGGIATAIGQGFSHHWVGMAMTIASTIATIIGSIETAEQRAERLKKEAEEANNAYIEKKSTYKDLKSEIAKVKELEKARYDSAEANEEYLESVNKLAELSPMLVDYYDAEGNAVISLANDYGVLSDARLQAAAAASKASQANIAQTQNDVKESRKQLIESFRISKWSNIWMTPIDPDYVPLDTKTQNSALAIMNSMFIESKQLSELSSPMKDYFSIIFDLLKIAPSDKLLADNLPEETESYIINSIMNILGNEDNWKKIMAFYRDEEVISNLSPSGKKAMNEQIQAMSVMRAARLATEASEKQAVTTDTYWAIQGTLSEDNISDSLKKLYEDKGTSKLIGDYLIQKKGDTSYENFSGDLQRYYLDISEQLTAFWNNLYDPKVEEKFLNLIHNLSDYNSTDFNKVLEQLEIKNEGFTQEIYTALSNSYNNAWNEVHERFIEAQSNIINNRNSDLVLDDSVVQQYTANQIQAVYDFQKQILNSIESKQILSSTGGQLLDAFIALNDNINTAITDQAKKIEVQSIVNKWDDFSYSGLVELREKLIEESLITANDAISQSITSLISHTVPNFVTEYGALSKKATEGLEDLTKALQNAISGMDYKDAVEMANKLGKTLADFRQVDGKFYYDNYADVTKAYGGKTFKTYDRLNAEFNKYENLLGENGIAANLYAAYQDAGEITHEQFITDEVRNAFEGITDTQLDYLLQQYDIYYEDFAREKPEAIGSADEFVAFSQYVYERLSEAKENLDKLPELIEYQTQLAIVKERDTRRQDTQKVLQKAITGGMGDTEVFEFRNTLASQFSIDSSKFTFNRTVEGLQLSKESAVLLYDQLRKIDSIQAELVFKEMRDSLMETDEHYQTIGANLAYIAELNEKIRNADGQTSNARLEQYKAELAVAKEILEIRSTSEDSSWDFMSAPLPGGLQNAPTYWEAWAKSVSVVEKANQDKYMGWEDFTRLVQGVQDLAVQTGENMVFMGVEFSKDGETAGKLIENGYKKAFTVDSDSNKAVLDLGKLIESTGLQFSEGAAGFSGDVESGIREVADGQVKMLDSMIKLVETIIKMQELGDIDTSGNGVLDLGEIWDIEATEDELKDTTQLTGKAREALEKIWADISDINSEYGAAFNDIKISWGNTVESLYSIFQQAVSGDTNNWDIDLKGRFATMLNSLYRTAISEGWSTDDIAANLRSMLAGEGYEGTIEVGDIKWTFHMGRSFVTVERDGETFYVVDGTEYQTLTEATQAAAMQEAFASHEGLQGRVADEGIVNAQNQTLTMTLTYGEASIEMTVDENGKILFNGQENLEDAEKKLLQDKIAEIGDTSPELSDSTISAKARVALDMEVVTDARTLNNIDSTIHNQLDEILKDPNISDTEFTKKLNVLIEAEPQLAGLKGKSQQEVIEALNLEYGVQQITVKVSPDSDPLFTDNPVDLGSKQATVRLEFQDGTAILYKGDSDEPLSAVPTQDLIGESNVNEITATYNADANTIIIHDKNGEPISLITNNNGATGVIHLTSVTSSSTATSTSIGIVGADGNRITLIKTNGAGEINLVQVAAKYNRDTDTITIYEQDGKTPLTEIKRNADGTFTIGNATATYDETTNQLTWVGADGNPLPDNYTLPMGEYGAEADINKVQVNWGANPEDIIKTQIPDVVSKDVWIYINPHEADWGIKEYGQRVQDYFNGIIYSSTEIESPIEGAVAAFEYFCKVVEQAPSIDIAQNLLGITEENWPQYQNLLIESSQALKLQLPGLDVESYNDFINTLSLLQEYFQNINRSEVNVDTENSEEKLNELSDVAKQINDEIADVNNSTASPSTYTNPIDNLNNKLQTTLRLIGSVNSTKVNPKTSGSSIIDNVKNFFGANAAKGNTALAAGAQSTLMGELGPELYVTNGHYYVAGQNGAEFVDLPKDAIVFNHLQTRRLMQNGFSGRGKPTTNEKNATSFAKGNYNGGSAKASASAALSALRQLRAQWQALAGMSVSDLAGKGGGGGGGGGGKNDTAIFVRDVERWYNWLQKIARLEEQITYQEQLRSKLSSDFIPNGEAYYKSQMKSLEALKEQAATAGSLAISQEEYFEKRRKELNENSPLNRFYTFDEYGKLIYEPSGFSELSQLFGRNDQGQPNLTAKEQYEWLVSQGFGDYMKYDNSGKEIKKEEDEDEETFYQNSVQAFSDRMDSEKEEMENLHDSIEEQKKAVLEKMQTANELLQEMQDNQIEVENSVLDAIIDIRDREIDEMEKQKDALKESTDKMIDGLTDALNREKKMYENQENENELNKMRRQLSILQRSGGSASQIANLQKDIESKERDAYFDKQQQQIDAIQEASDAEIERMDHQIEIAEEALEYQKEHGLLWEQVSQIMQGSPEAIAHFIMENNSSFWKDSPAMSQKNYRDTLFQAGEWTAMRDSIGNIYNALVSDWDIFNRAMEITFGDSWTNETANAVKETFENEIANSGDIAEAEKSVQKTEEYKTMKEEADKKAAAEEQNNSILQKKEDNTVKEEQADVWYQSDYTLAITTKEGKPGTYPGYGLGRTEQEALANAYYMSSHPKNLPEGAKINGLASGPSKPYKIYKSGGLIDYTGPAWVDGSKEEPESIWDAKTTALMKENLLNTDKLNLLKTFWDTLEQYNNNPLAGNTYVDKTESVIIENATVNMNVQQLANDYDARRAGETVMDEMVKIGRKNGFQNNIRR